LSEAVEAAMAASLGGPAEHRGHRYSLEDFGLDTKAVGSAVAL
jgi:hypothetical protein